MNIPKINQVASWRITVGYFLCWHNFFTYKRVYLNLKNLVQLYPILLHYWNTNTKYQKCGFLPLMNSPIKWKLRLDFYSHQFRQNPPIVGSEIKFAFCELIQLIWGENCQKLCPKFFSCTFWTAVFRSEFNFKKTLLSLSRMYVCCWVASVRLWNFKDGGS